MELIKGKYDSIDFKPPAGVRAAAKRGLELRRKFGRGGLSAQQAGEQGIGSGVQRASNLSNGSAVSPDTIKRMVSFFARHERNKNSKMPNGEPGAGMIAWLLWGGDPGQRWANKVKGQMDKIDEVKKNISIEGVTVSIEDLLSALKQPAGGQREALREAQRKRQDKYRIRVQPGGALTIPAALARLGAKAEDFADPVNFRYPVWLTKPDRDSLTPTQLAQVRNAPARFAQFADRYDPMSRAQVESRIDEARKKFQIGEFAETEKSWDYEIVKADKEKQIVYGVALRPDRADSQGDIITKDEIELAAHNFMIASRRGDLQHKELLSEDEFKVVESSIARVDEPPHIIKGDWVMAVKLSNRLWKQVKAGKINAFSIRGIGRRRPLR